MLFFVCEISLVIVPFTNYAMLQSLKGKRILLIVAHPDDEVLGVGATMYRLIHEYDCTVRVVILGEGITSRSDARDVQKWESELAEHRRNIDEAARCIGFESVVTHSFPDNRFDSVALLDIIKVVEAEKADFAPEVIFTHHGGDVNVDHQLTYRAVLTACRPMEHELVKSIITFETPSGTEWQGPTEANQFLPNLFVQVSAEGLAAKSKAMESYTFEKRPYPHPRSPEALEILAKRRGVQVGVKLAEAFVVVRQVVV